MMVEWLKRLVVGEDNVVVERSSTNWNTLDVAAIVAAKKRERMDESQPASPAQREREPEE